MVPLNALPVKTLITHPHDANAEKRKHETKSVPVRTQLRGAGSRDMHTGRLTHKCRFRPQRWAAGG
jgi:hypothetical protein